MSMGTACQVWFTPRDKNIWDQLRNIQSVETSYKKLGNIGLSE